MKRNPKRRTVIVASLLTCFQGVVGCRAQGRLKAGIELVVQVQLQDAFVAFADSAIDQIKTDLRKNNIRISDDAITRTEPKTVEEADKVEIEIKGIPALQAPDIRRILTGPPYAQWTLTSLTSSGYRLNPTAAASLQVRRNTMDASIKIIKRKVEALGLTTWIEPAGRSPNDAELLVQLPPVDDPAHVLGVLQTKGILEWDQVIEGPFGSPEEALAQHGGARPLNTKIVPEVSHSGIGRRYWIVSSIPILRSSDIINASASIGEARGWETEFVLSPGAAQRLEAYTSANIGKQAAIVVDGQALTVPTIQSAISARGRITGSMQQLEASDLAIALNTPMLAGLVMVEERTIRPARTANGK